MPASAAPERRRKTAQRAATSRNATPRRSARRPGGRTSAPAERRDDRDAAGQQRGVRAVAGEVLAHRELEPRERRPARARRRAAARAGRRQERRRRARRARQDAELDRAGTAPTAASAPRRGARGASSAAAAARRRLGAARLRACSPWAAARSALRLASSPSLPSACGCGVPRCQVANGQPRGELDLPPAHQHADEAEARAHLPDAAAAARRGRAAQIAHEAVRPGSSSIRSSSTRACLALARARSSAPRAGQARRRASSRTLSSSPSVEQPRGRAARGTAVSIPPSRERPRRARRQLALEPGDLLAQGARGRRASSTRRVCAGAADTDARGCCVEPLHAPPRMRVYPAAAAVDPRVAQRRRRAPRCTSRAPPRRGSAGRPATCTRRARSASLRVPGTASSRRLAEQLARPARSASATTSRPGGSVRRELARPRRSPRRAGRSPSGPSTASASSAQTRHAGLEQREQQRVVDAARASEAAVEQALDRRRLDRRAVDVGVEADVAEEDAVGVRAPARARSSIARRPSKRLAR